MQVYLSIKSLIYDSIWDITVTLTSTTEQTVDALLQGGVNFRGYSENQFRDILTNDTINSRLLVITFQWTSISFRASTRQQNPWKLVFSEYWWHHVTRDFYCTQAPYEERKIFYLFILNFQKHCFIFDQYMICS